ncbi:MAG: polysaccharide biosynthesis/export family protein [Planctomycetota bacterium]
MRSGSAAAICLLTLLMTGCTALTQPINGVPARRLPRQFFQEEKNNLVPIDITLLAQEEPRQYTLGPGDTLAIVVNTLWPFAEPGQVPELPPVHLEQEKPYTGFPVTILDDGTISLPLLKPLRIEGMTADQARDLIRKSYIDAKILKKDEQEKASVLVTLIRKRQVSVVVIRQDTQGANLAGAGGNQLQLGATGRLGVDYSANGQVVKLDAFKNDVLNALMNTGGLPGVAAKNEIKILRSTAADKAARMRFMQEYGQMLAMHCDPCSCPPPMPEDPTVLRIPLRLPPGAIPNLSPEDVILEDGDIVMIETRDTEFFFTGGLLPGGQFPLPRDYDLDALGAMALAGYGVNNQARGGAGLAGIGASAQVIPPGRLYILRKTPCKGQLAIEVDLAKAVNDPSQRPIIQPGDTLILQYKPCEEAINFGIGTFFTYGIQQLFRN